MTVLRSAQSIEYVEATVAVTNRLTGVAIDPTGDVVSLAFVAAGSALDGTTSFTAAAWVTTSDSPPVYIAQLLAGPGQAYVPVAGTRIDVYVKVTDSPEVPAIHAGNFKFT